MEDKFSKQTIIFTDLGSERADSVSHQQERQESIDQSRSIKAGILRTKTGRRANTEDLPSLNAELLTDYPEVKASAKTIDEYLNPASFVAARMMLEDENLDKDSALSQAEEYLEKRNSSESQQSTLTFGLEVELGRPRKLTKSSADLQAYAKMVDQMQDIGVMIDNDSYREVKLSKSQGANDQSRSVFEMERLGVIQPEQSVGIHVNVAGFENPKKYIADFILLHLMFSGTDYFGKTRIPNNSVLNLPQHSRKNLSEDFLEVRNVPIRIKPGGIVEFRGLLKKWESSPQFAKSLRTFEPIAECLGEYTKQTALTDQADLTGKAELWANIKAEFLSGVAEYGKTTGNEQLSKLPEFIDQVQGFTSIYVLYREILQDLHKVSKGSQDYAKSPEYLELRQSKLRLEYEIFQMVKHDEEFWDLYFKGYGSGEAAKFPKQQIEKLRSINDNEEQFEFLRQMNPHFGYEFNTIFSRRLEEMGKYWGAMVAATKDDTFRKKNTNRLIQYRGKVRGANQAA